MSKALTTDQISLQGEGNVPHSDALALNENAEMLTPAAVCALLSYSPGNVVSLQYANNLRSVCFVSECVVEILGGLI